MKYCFQKFKYKQYEGGEMESWDPSCNSAGLHILNGEQDIDLARYNLMKELLITQIE